MLGLLSEQRRKKTTNNNTRKKAGLTRKKETAKKLVSKSKKNQKPNHIQKGTGIICKASEVLKGLFSGGLDGWKDDREKFKIELINDIKTFLFSSWKKPWSAGLVFEENGNIASGFRNISGRLYKNRYNILTMEQNTTKSPFFTTIDYLRKHKGKIKDKTKVIGVLSYIPMWKDKEDKTPRKPDWFMPKITPSINVEFTEGIKKPILKNIKFINHELNEYVENFIKELKKRKRVPKIVIDQADSCHYQPTRSLKNDSIHMVNVSQFDELNEYYSTLFHEIIHSTMNPLRCGRGDLNRSKSLDYANEELVAEIGAMILCTEMGLNYNRDNNLTYLKGWLSKTVGDIDENLLEAYGFACDAADYLLKDIDINSLVPETMTRRIEEPKAKQTDKKKKDSNKKSPLPKPIIKTEKRSVKTKNKDDGQTSLWGVNDKEAVSLDKWKPNTQITKLKGELGEFIGGYERNQFALVLRGEKGAGKTRLLCQLIDMFVSEGMSCKFKSLEVSPQSELFGNYTGYISDKNKKLVFADSNTDLKALEEDCKKYDCVAVDSWGKLKNVQQEDFIRLIEKYPKVIWLVIFQSTTNGTARGGIMSEYDSSIVVQVARGGNAECEKNRYNSCDKIYNVFDEKIIRDEN